MNFRTLAPVMAGIVPISPFSLYGLIVPNREQWIQRGKTPLSKP